MDAIAAWTLAAQRGADAAWVNIGRQLAKMPGAEADAIMAFKRGIRAGYNEAWFDIGFLLEPIQRRRNSAIQAYEKAIACGSVGAHANLGLLYSKVPADEDKAIQVFRDGIQAGDHGSYNNLAHLLLKRSGSATGEVIELLEQGAELRQPDSIVNLAGIRAQSAHADPNFENRLVRDASAGDHYAALGLASLLYHRTLIENSGSNEHCKWLIVAAKSTPMAIDLIEEWCA